MLATDVTIGGVIVYAIAGLIIGAIARLILPGKQSMSLVATMVLGIIAAIIGGIAWNALFPNNDGVAWIGSIIVAVILLAIYERVVARRA